MFHQSWKMARATMGAIGLLVLLFLVAACGSFSPTLAASSLQGAHSSQKGNKSSCKQPQSSLHLQSLLDAQLAQLGFPPPRGDRSQSPTMDAGAGSGAYPLL